jgi:hypothetical protein
MVHQMPFKDPEKRRAYSREKAMVHYYRHHEKSLQKRREQHKKVRTIIQNEKIKRGKCVNCGLICTWENVVGFDWDHEDQTTKVMNLNRTNAAVSKIFLEIAKCRLLCAICHRILTHENNQHLFNNGRLFDNGRKENIQYLESDQLELDL